MESAGDKSDKNRAFLRWIRSLPAERRKDELQRIVSGGVLNGTSAKSALFKLQRRCYVKLQRLDMMRGMVACATACSNAPVAAVPAPPLCTSPPAPCSSPSAPCPSPPPLSPSPTSSLPKSKRALAASRPCPLSRKRPSDTDRNEDRKRSRTLPEELSSTASGTVTVSEPRTETTGNLESSENRINEPPVCTQPAEPSLPCPVSDQSKEPQSSDIPQPKASQSSDQSEESQSSNLVQSKPNLSPGHAQSEIPVSSGSATSKDRQSSVIKSSNNSTGIPSKPALPRVEPSKQQLPKPVTKSQPHLPHHRVNLTPRVVDESLKDVANCIHDVEKELFNIDQKLFAFEKMAASHKTQRTLDALLETSNLMLMKAAVIKSCVERGVADVLGYSFYPKLLSEVNKIPQLKLYSSLRLTTMVNLLLDLSKPNVDPKYTVNAFIAQTFNEWRPAENNRETKLPKQTVPLAPKLPAGSSPSQANAVTSASQTALNLYSESMRHQIRNVEVTPPQAQHMQPQAPAPHLTTLQQQQQRLQYMALYKQQLQTIQQQTSLHRTPMHQERTNPQQVTQNSSFSQASSMRPVPMQQSNQHSNLPAANCIRTEPNPYPVSTPHYPSQHSNQTNLQIATKTYVDSQGQVVSQQVLSQQYCHAAVSGQPPNIQSQQYASQAYANYHRAGPKSTAASQAQAYHAYPTGVPQSTTASQAYHAYPTGVPQSTTASQAYHAYPTGVPQSTTASQAYHAYPTGVAQSTTASQAYHAYPTGVPQSTTASQAYPAYPPGVPTSTAAQYNTYNSSLPVGQQGVPVDRMPETASHMFMTGQEHAQNGFRVVKQNSPVARTLSRDSGIETPEPPPQYEDTYVRSAATAAAWNTHRPQ